MSLPDEMLLCVFAHLDPRDLAAAASVCAQWSRAARDDPLWRRHVLAAGWPGAGAARPCAPPCGWRAAARRMAVGSVLVLYVGTDGGRALASVTSVAVRARRTLSQAVAAVDAAVGYRGLARRRRAVFVPTPSRHGDRADTPSASSMSRWQEAPVPTVPLAAIGAVLWDDAAGSVRGTLRVSDSPLVSVSLVRPTGPSVWLIACDVENGDGTGAAGACPPVGFVHVVDQVVGRNGAWTDRGRGTILCRGMAYEGEWCRGRPEGFGIGSRSEDGRYAGRWRNGRREGRGRRDGHDGTGYQGQWARDVPHGRGRRWYPDGRTYDGTFLDGMQHGPGVIIAPNGTCMPVLWNMGVLVNVLPVPMVGEVPARVW